MRFVGLEAELQEGIVQEWIKTKIEKNAHTHVVHVIHVSDSSKVLNILHA
jgi:hypothetical protein